MKKLFTTFLVIIMCAAALAGCASPASSGASGSPSSDGSSPSYTPVPTTPPDVTIAPVSDDDNQDEEMQAVTYNGWVYYLDVNDAIVVDYNEDPPLHMKKEDGSGDQQLGIRGFQYDIIGSYIYVNSNDPDMDENGTQTWSTTRMGLDGSGKIKLEYGSMSARLIPEGEQKFYFTTLGECAIYISDFACENVQTLVIALPDKSTIDNKVGAGKVLQISINDITNGYINFDVTLSSGDGLLLYKGGYKITVDGQNAEKTDDGTYYTYGQQENE